MIKLTFLFRNSFLFISFLLNFYTIHFVTVFPSSIPSTSFPPPSLANFMLVLSLLLQIQNRNQNKQTRNSMTKSSPPLKKTLDEKTQQNKTWSLFGIDYSWTRDLPRILANIPSDTHKDCNRLNKTCTGSKQTKSQH